MTEKATEKFRVTSPRGGKFIWIKGDYAIKNIGGKEYIVPIEHLYTYKPDLGNFVIDILNLELESTEILRFVRKYGLLGICFFKAKNQPEVTDGIEEIRQHYSGTPGIPEETLNKIVYSMTWRFRFGENLREGTKIPSGWAVWHGFGKDGVSNTGFENKNTEEDTALWDNYREPLDDFKETIDDFKKAIESYFWKTPHYLLKLTLQLDSNNNPISPVYSLIEGAYAKVILNTAIKKNLKKCVGVERHLCKKCDNNKMYFWHSDKQRNQIWGVLDCKINVNHRAACRRKGDAKKVPSRGTRKQRKL